MLRCNRPCRFCPALQWSCLTHLVRFMLQRDCLLLSWLLFCVILPVGLNIIIIIQQRPSSWLDHFSVLSHPEAVVLSVDCEKTSHRRQFLLPHAFWPYSYTDTVPEVCKLCDHTNEGQGHSHYLHCPSVKTVKLAVLCDVLLVFLYVVILNHSQQVARWSGSVLHTIYVQDSCTLAVLKQVFSLFHGGESRKWNLITFWYLSVLTYTTQQ